MGPREGREGRAVRVITGPLPSTPEVRPPFCLFSVPPSLASLSQTADLPVRVCERERERERGRARVREGESRCRVAGLPQAWPPACLASLSHLPPLALLPD